MHIHTKRLSISEFSEHDISEVYLSWLRSPEVMKYSNQRFRSHTKESCIRYLDSFKKTRNLFLKITENETNQMIGTATIYRYMQHKRADTGLLIGSEYWGKGFGKEAWNGIIEILEGDKDIEKLTAGTSERNLSMRNIIESSGFIHEATLTKHEIIENERVDIYYYSRFTCNV